jgi:hypothetical protein
MFLSRFHIITWLSLISIGVPSVFGQGLHFVAGIDHQCACETRCTSGCRHHHSESSIAPDDFPTEGRVVSALADCLVCRFLAQFVDPLLIYKPDASSDRVICSVSLDGPLWSDACDVLRVARGPPNTIETLVKGRIES